VCLHMTEQRHVEHTFWSFTLRSAKQSEERGEALNGKNNDRFLGSLSSSMS
jgi:hypothetical protein